MTESGDRAGILGGEALRSALGFRTGEAFRLAAREGRVPVHLFKLPGRRGWFARERDVREWQSRVLGKTADAGDSDGDTKGKER